MQNQFFSHEVNPTMPTYATAAVRAILAQVYISGSERHPHDPILDLEFALTEKQGDIRRASGMHMELTPMAAPAPFLKIELIRSDGQKLPQAINIHLNTLQHIHNDTEPFDAAAAGADRPVTGS